MAPNNAQIRTGSMPKHQPQSTMAVDSMSLVCHH